MTTDSGNKAMELLARIIAEQLISDGVSRVDALMAASHIIARLQEARGGREIYVPSPRQQRETEIVQDWRQGKKPKDIAAQRNVDPSTVYRTIERHRRASDRDQETGFGSDDWVL